MRGARNSRFSRSVLYYTDRMLFKFAAMGKLEELICYTLLKKETESGHIHDKEKPLWYEKSQSQWYRVLTGMQQMGLIRKEPKGKGYRLVKLKKVDGKRGQYFNPQSTMSKTFNQLKIYFEKEILRKVFLRQLRAIAKKKTSETHPDISNLRTLAKARRQWFDVLLQMNAARKTMKDDEFKTNLTCKKLGAIFGKSKWYGWAKFLHYIKEGYLERRIWYKAEYIHHGYDDFKKLLIQMYDRGYKFHKGMFYKIHSAFSVRLENLKQPTAGIQIENLKLRLLEKCEMV